MTAERIWFVCPVYNDVDPFALLRQRILDIFAGCAEELRFVVIDDTAGADDQMSTLRGLANVSVVEPPFNLGHQRAIVYGLRKTIPEISDDDIVVTLDADGQDRPEDIQRLLAALREDDGNPRRVALARRTKRRETFVFKFCYLLFRLMFRILTGTVINTGNFAAFRGRLAKQVLQHPYFDLCYSSTLNNLDADVRLVPCERGPRYAGRSRMSFMALLMHGLRMLTPFTEAIAIRTLLLFSVSFALGIIGGIVVVSIRLFTDAALPGWATSTLLLIMTLSFVALGNFIVLFVTFSQSRGVSFANLEQLDHV